MSNVLIGRTLQKFGKILVMVLFFFLFLVNFMILLSKNRENNLLHIQIVTLLHVYFALLNATIHQKMVKC